jgi:hypothetical protein
LQPSHELDPIAVKQVLRYFVGHPHAADDLESVARWRLAEDAIYHTVHETERALAWLVARDYLRVSSAATSTPLFTLNVSKLLEARALLGESQPERVPGGRE